MYMFVFLCTDHAAALLTAVQPRRSTAVKCAPALVQTLAAGPVVAARTAVQIFIWISTVTGSPPAVCLSVLHKQDQRGNWSDRLGSSLQEAANNTSMQGGIGLERSMGAGFWPISEPRLSRCPRLRKVYGAFHSSQPAPPAPRGDDVMEM